MRDMIDNRMGRTQEYAENLPYERFPQVLAEIRLPAVEVVEPKQTLMDSLVDAISNLWDRLLGCSHAKTSFPISPVDSSDQDFPAREVCLDCGAEFEYDFRTMRRGRKIPPASHFKSWEGTRYGKR